MVNESMQVIVVWNPSWQKWAISIEYFEYEYQLPFEFKLFSILYFSSFFKNGPQTFHCTLVGTHTFQIEFVIP